MVKLRLLMPIELKSAHDDPSPKALVAIHAFQRMLRLHVGYTKTASAVHFGINSKRIHKGPNRLAGSFILANVSGEACVPTSLTVL